MTLPDLVENSAPGAWGAAIVVNSTPEELRNWTIECQLDYYTSRVPLPSIPPLSIRKVPFRIQSSKNAASNELSASLTLVPPKSFSQPLGAATPIRLRVRRPDQSRKITFQSRMDGSIQYYALQPATDTQPPAPRAGLVLSLHGASVEAIGQADAYAPKSGLHIVCPTNRRPYGFDWEEWGRMDALEVLNLAQNSLGTDPQRVYLTGHSMGGHGTWNLGVTFPEHFAAIAPSAGWISFASYVGGRSPKPGTNAMDRLMQRAAASSDTLGLATNYLSQSIYILHGDADDNVPVTQARTMRAHLSGIGATGPSLSCPIRNSRRANTPIAAWCFMVTATPTPLGFHCLKRARSKFVGAPFKSAAKPWRVKISPVSSCAPAPTVIAPASRWSPVPETSGSA